MQRIRLVTFVLLTWATYTQAQLQLVGLPHGEPLNSRARTKAAELTLPFWDDFSFTKGDVPDDSLWLNGTNVWVNDGLGINPPSIRVATFDGTDGTGKPYNVNDVLAKGYADKLESQVIRLDQVDPAVRSGVYIRFYYQMKGRGELPDVGDLLILQFKNVSEKWETVWSRENDGTLVTDQFYPVQIDIADERFYHDKFQFRFQNFARLSGPYDTWHVDYIFISNGTNSTDPPNFPDRTIVSKHTPLFDPYTSIPYVHFKETAASSLVAPKIIMTNLREDQILIPNVPSGQPVNFFSDATITSFTGDAKVQNKVTLDSDEKTDEPLIYGNYTVVSLKTMPAFSDFDASADSATVSLDLRFNTRDNTVRTLTEGDYRPEVYSPIDFRTNDTTRLTYPIWSYYAYDDGKAEYGAALNQPGAQLAYEFNRLGVEHDTITALEMYFPRFGDETSQVIELRIWSALTDNPDDVLYKEVVTLQRSSQNVFWRKKLAEPKKVPARFYIGWKQSTAAVIAVGLDKNSDSAEKMFFNTIGTWEQNNLVRGSLMFRPIFGRGKAGPNTGLDEVTSFNPYPNPNNGIFELPGHPESVAIFDLAGRSIPYESTGHEHSTEITLNQPSPGLYVVHSTLGGRVYSTKLVVGR